MAYKHTLILLYDIAEPMLVIKAASGTIYRNQVGGEVCFQAEVEGVLAPLDVDENLATHLAQLPFPTGTQGISAAIADSIDVILQASRSTSFCSVDRSRLADSWEAWVHVVAETPTWWATETGLGSVFGLGSASAVLTWPNSD